ncbi:MAG: type III secretion system export apparatus subunit SctU [Planctomycetota bacterium]|jgi:type III secretion protein U|nr:type III secretion system export apparatus subunit SctU [Planctomycetota bacterium]
MSGEKTEQPTDKNLRDAREQGQVIKSQEIPAAAVVLSAFLFVWVGFDWLTEEIKGLMLAATENIPRPFGDSLPAMTDKAARVFLLLTLPFVILAATAGSIGHLAQAGLVLAWKAAIPKLDKLNPKQWFSKVFSLKNLFEFLRSLIKIGVVAAVFYLVFMDALPLVLRLPGHGLPAVDTLIRTVMRQTASYCLAAFAAIAAADWLFQRHQFLKEHMMSKEDVKNEYKEMEGDPQIKGQRRQLHQEMAMNDQAQSVRKSDVLVTNPTHLAIAIEYKAEKTPLPVILAKGEGAMAERMIRVAEEAGVPIMRNVPLARDLWEQGRELEYIPSGLIEPVAEVLVWLRELREREGGVQ